ncbi:MAG: hypothetical protein AAF316_13465 [Cyanobacteria bacterium P01_A01_bin.80]
MSKLDLLNNIPGVEDLTNENAETVSGGSNMLWGPRKGGGRRRRRRR